MAGRLIGAWNPALDDEGKPISGALLYTYLTGGVTPKATYTDVSLGTPQANPVVADAAGRFPELWAADGAVFDLKWTDAAGSQEKLFEAIQSLGATATGAVTRDFGADGRFNLESRGGTTFLEAGDPSPDNTGGKLTLGGWGGTALDVLTLNATALATPGTLEPGAGIKFPAVVAPSTDPNTLDDYEEGTWTPTLVGDTGASGQVYGDTGGSYIKIGRKVFVTGLITLSTKGTLTGTFAVIGGLPFPLDLIVAGSGNVGGVGKLLIGAGFSNHYSSDVYWTYNGAAYVYMNLKKATGTTVTLAFLADVSSGAILTFAFEYLAAS